MADGSELESAPLASRVSPHEPIENETEARKAAFAEKPPVSVVPSQKQLHPIIAPASPSSHYVFTIMQKALDEIETVGRSRELSLAKQRLEESIAWINAHYKRHGTNKEQ